MHELLQNIDSLISHHFEHKIKYVKWTDSDTEDFVNDKIEEVLDKIYDYAFEEIWETHDEIDKAIQKMEQDWEENPLSRKNFNVHMLKHRKEGYE